MIDKMQRACAVTRLRRKFDTWDEWSDPPINSRLFVNAREVSFPISFDKQTILAIRRFQGKMNVVSQTPTCFHDHIWESVKIEWDRSVCIDLNEFGFDWTRLIFPYQLNDISVTFERPLKLRRFIAKHSAGVSSLGLSFLNRFNCWTTNAFATVHGFNLFRLNGDRRYFECFHWNICFS
jgi:hypothetical protein